MTRKTKTGANSPAFENFENAHNNANSQPYRPSQSKWADVAGPNPLILMGLERS